MYACVYVLLLHVFVFLTCYDMFHAFTGDYPPKAFCSRQSVSPSVRDPLR